MLSRRLLLLLATLGTGFSGYLMIHGVLERVARWTEVELEPNLWWKQDYRQVVTPTNYVGRGAGRVLLYGDSQVREAFIIEDIEAQEPGVDVYQHGQSIGTLKDLLVLLQFIEEAYGDSAHPERLVFGVSSRVAAGLGFKASPLVGTIDRFTPYRVDRDAVSIVEKGTWDALRSRFDWMSEQGIRYRSALKALSYARSRVFVAEDRASTRFQPPLVSSVYRHQADKPESRARPLLSKPNSFWDELHSYDFEGESARIRADFARLRELVDRMGIELIVVNMPEISWNRELYEPGVYEAYRAILAEGLQGFTYLDLRTFLADDEYHDHCHANLAGSRRLTERLVRLLRDGD